MTSSNDELRELKEMFQDINEHSYEVVSSFRRLIDSDHIRLIDSLYKYADKYDNLDYTDIDLLLSTVDSVKDSFAGEAIYSSEADPEYINNVIDMFAKAIIKVISECKFFLYNKEGLSDHTKSFMYNRMLSNILDAKADENGLFQI